MSENPASSKRSGPWIPYRWEMLIWLWLCFFFNQADRQVFSTVLPSIKADLDITDVQAGLIASLFIAALALTVPFAGYAGDVFNRAKIVTWAVFGWSLATLLSGFGSSFIYLILVRSLATGSGEAFYAPAANALIAEHHSATRARAMAVHQTSLYFGVIASGLVAGWIADQYGWRASFWVFGGCGIILAGFLAWRLQGPGGAIQRPQPPKWSEIADVARRPTVLLLVFAWSCMVFVNVGYMTWMPTYLHEQFGQSLAKAGFSSMFYHHLGAFAGVVAGGYFSDRWGKGHPHARLLLQGAALLAATPFIWMLGSQAGIATLYVALGGFGFFRGIYDAGIYASLFEVIEPRLRSTVVGLAIAVAYAVGAFAPVLLGWAKGGTGLASSFSLLAVVYAAGGIAIWIATKVFFAKDHQTANRLGEITLEQ